MGARDDTRISLRKASTFAKATEDKTVDRTEDKLIRTKGFIWWVFHSQSSKH